MSSFSQLPSHSTPGLEKGYAFEEYETVPQGKRRGRFPRWAKIAIPILLVVIVAAVVGGVVGGVVGKKDNDNSGGGGNGQQGGNNPTAGTSSGSGAIRSVKNSYSDSLVSSASNAAKAGGGDDLFFTGTDLYGNPIFKTSSIDSGSPSTSSSKATTCGSDPDASSLSGSLSKLRSHPRLIAPEYQWDCLASRIQSDAYLTVWNATIFANASAWYSLPPTNYSIDGGFTGSGILDVAREVQQRVRAWAYVARATNDQKWVDRTWRELSVAAANTSTYFGQDQPTPWNALHFLDTAEMTTAFAIAYDWLYPSWNATQKAYIVDWIKRWGLQPGMQAYTTADGWWTMAGNNNGNWNCVCNSGMILGALAIAGDDDSGLSSQILSNGIANMKQGCMTGVSSDGTWSETANYWYFGTNAQARAVSALTTATGNDQGLMASNPNWIKTAYYHMFVSGNGGMYAYGDNGPNKYSANANGLFLWSQIASDPRPALFQRDRADAAGDPLSMFWYDTSVRGGFWSGLALDRFFSVGQNAWASMRSSWTDFEGTYVAIKSSNATGHQSHGDLDAGNFVIDAMGTRWAGEYGNADYLSEGYFSSEKQDSARWQYFRKGTQGQNTLVIGMENQIADCQPQNRFESTNVTQTDSVSFKPAKTDAAYFVTDMSSAYGLASGSVKRGIRMLNARREILLQDELSSAVNADVQWRVQTNATITLSEDKRTATLQLQRIVNPNAAYGGLTADLTERRTMIVKILDPTPSGAVFSVQAAPAKRIYGSEPAQTMAGVIGDQPNTGVSVLSIEVAAGGTPATIAVVWQPQWDDLDSDDSALPKQVQLDQWTVTSHN
ncbi:unnamed protein product [Tilletia controversa]|uniref:Heparinase II/III-like C-terminal domain-containing protein n=1 Tax=Tilletia controversa TaxID=13291 RepID=A0A8X7SSZ0_9BASI|nr:hypothetical protein CF328_g7970 [Tilletia controversa]KAE8238711.1 hypothetical protein A4X06_0g8655 [Tilletia controversa]CAD6911655.1 unnamed protein product [Tilletia controversa]